MNPYAAAMITIVLGVLAFGLWYQNQNPRRIVSEGSVTVPARKPGTTTMQLRTRIVDIGGRQFSEVEMPNGTWIGCEGDCVNAAREAKDELWEKLDRIRP